MINKIRCDKLIKKANTLNPASTLSITEIKHLENRLKVIIPDDFKYINTRYHYEYINFCEFRNFANTGVGSVTYETNYYRREYNLLNCYLVLFSDSVSFLIFKTISNEKSNVIWCSYNDFFNLCEGKPFEYNPTIFQSFTDFFEFLLDEEEKIQNE